jgi:hypothetical protein
MAEPLILDPFEPSGFRPAGSTHGGGIEILNDPIDVGTYDDFGHDDGGRVDTRGSRPSMAQRMSGLSIGGPNGTRTVERRPSRTTGRSKRDSVISSTKAGDKFQFYRFEKDGTDWQYARRRNLVASQSDMEKQVRKWRGSILEETKRMGELRSSQLKRLIEDVNAEDSSSGSWEAALIDSIRNGTKVTRMDVILMRSNKPKSSNKSSAAAGQLVDVLQPSKDKSKDKDKKEGKNKDKDDHDGDKKHDRKDSVLDDPFQESILFDRTGKPMDDKGILEFANGGFPPEIPHDRPIGWRPEPEEHKKGKKREKSKDRGDDFGFDDDAIVKVDEHLPDGGMGGDHIDVILRGDGHSRRGSRSRSRAGSAFEPIEVEAGRRSGRAQSYHGDARRMSSRRRSVSRPDGIRFPPNYDMGRPPSDVLSSTSSNESRYALDREERSSYTSRDTYDDMVGRGSGYDDGHGKSYHRDSYSRYPPEKGTYYKEHHRGPSMSRSRGPSGRTTPRYHGGAEVYETTGSRRKSTFYNEPIPEDRRIGFSDDPYSAGPLVRRSTYDNGYDHPPPQHRYSRNYEEMVRPRDVKLHYPGEDMVDLKSRERDFGRERYAEDYQRESVKDDYIDRRERNIGRREDRMDDLERDRDRDRDAGRYYEHRDGGGRYDDGYYHR